MDQAGMTLIESKIKAATIHLLISAAIGALAAVLVFLLWYPYPFPELSGGRDLFFILIGVDIVLGPLLTFAVFNTNKKITERILDLSAIGALQLCALFYGLWTVFQARPVHIVFEYDRFRVVHASDVPQELMDRIPQDIAPMPVTGPTWLGLRPLNANEKFEFTIGAVLGGPPVAALPPLWRPYQESHDAIITAARPAEELMTRFPAHAQDLQNHLNRAGLMLADVAYLPLQGRRNKVWTVLLNGQTAVPLDFVPIDSF